MPDSPRTDARRFRLALIAMFVAVLALSGCGGVSDIKVPSIPDI